MQEREVDGHLPSLPLVTQGGGMGGRGGGGGGGGGRGEEEELLVEGGCDVRGDVIDHPLQAWREGGGKGGGKGGT